MADDTTHHDSQGSDRYVSPRQKRGRPQAKMQPPLTPMIDVTFQLLLFFLLTIVFRMEEGMILGSLPEKGLGQPSVDPLKEPITVRLLADGEFGKDVIFEVDSRSMTSGKELYDFFIGRIEYLGGSTDSPVIIAPQGTVRWQWVVEVFNQAARAEFKEIGFTRATG
ncbi:MAG: biopolymer transporter ExbD [Phycisphaerae bacterium]|nr:biopolymer transporter ExbD [Phycisphaerae bacterium]